MADPYVRQARGVFTGTVGSTDITAGSPVYFDGTDWELADADDNTKYAEAIAVNSFSAGDVGAFCRSCIIVDIDSPYTQGDQYFLSATAGSITATRPTGANNLKQVLGFGLSTSELYVDIAPVKELMVNVALVAGGGTAAVAMHADWGGVTLLANSDMACGSVMCPENCVGLEIAYMWWGNATGSPALDASDTYTIDVSAAVSDETNVATTDGIAAAALTCADNDIMRADVSAAFDGTGIIEAGNILGIDIDQAAEGAGGDDALILSCQLIFKVV